MDASDKRTKQFQHWKETWVGTCWYVDASIRGCHAVVDIAATKSLLLPCLKRTQNLSSHPRRQSEDFWQQIRTLISNWFVTQTPNPPFSLVDCCISWLLKRTFCYVFPAPTCADMIQLELVLALLLCVLIVFIVGEGLAFPLKQRCGSYTATILRTQKEYIRFLYG